MFIFSALYFRHATLFFARFYPSLLPPPLSSHQPLAFRFRGCLLTKKFFYKVEMVEKVFSQWGEGCNFTFCKGSLTPIFFCSNEFTRLCMFYYWVVYRIWNIRRLSGFNICFFFCPFSPCYLVFISDTVGICCHKFSRAQMNEDYTIEALV